MIRRRRKPEANNLDRWLVSYADFITLLFAFFVVMYALSSINEHKYQELSRSLVAAFTHQRGDSVIELPVPQQPQGTPAPPPPARPTAAEATQLKNIAGELHRIMSPLMESGRVSITRTDRGVAVEINAALLFASGTAVLADSSRQALLEVASILAGVPNPIQVEGYTDDTPISTPQFPSNWELSAARAASVVRLFVSAGVAPRRLVAIGYADNAPIASNATPEGRARNRRVTIMILARPQQTFSSQPVSDESAPPPPPMPEATP